MCGTDGAVPERVPPTAAFRVFSGDSARTGQEQAQSEHAHHTDRDAVEEDDPGGAGDLLTSSPV